jgi:tetratricopeptide (TPR) repeat protein
MRHLRGWLVVFLPLTLISCRSSSHYIDIADRSFSAGLYDDAALLYKKAIQKDTRNGEAYYRLGLVEQRRGNSLQALRALTTASALLPNREDVQTRLARLEMEIYLADRTHPARLYGDLQKAAERLLAKNPKSYEGLRIEALLAWTDGKLKNAIELFRAADQSQPGQADLIASWCQVLFQDGQFEEGDRRARDLIRTQPQYGTIYDELAGEYYSRQQREEALNIIKTKVANNPERIDDAMQLASWYAGYGEKEKMKAELDRLIAHPEIFPNAELTVGDFYVGRQEWPEAIRLYREGAALSPKRRIAYLKHLCDAWLAQGNVQEAAKDLGEILKANPNDETARVVNDSLSVSSGPPDKASAALDDLGHIVSKNPGNAVWRLAYASALAKTGNQDAAAGQFQETLKSRPDLLQARLALAQITQLKGDFRQTLQYADEILRVQPGLLEASFQRIAGLIGTQQYGIARLELTALEKQMPDNPEVQFQMASLDLAESKFEDAEARLRKLTVDSQTRIRALEALTSVYTASDRLDKAYETLSDDLTRDPDSDQIRSTAAELALRTRRYDDAFRLYQDLVQRNPQSAVFRKLLGAACQLRGDMPAAIANYEKAVELAPKDPAMLSMLADGLRAAGRNTEAIAEYRRMLKIAPDNASAMNNLAFLLAETGGHLDEAMGLIARALRQEPGSDPFKDTLGFIYVKQNQGDRGVQVLRVLAAKYPEAPDVHYHFALALAETGRKAQAQAEMEAALEKGASGSVRKEILNSLGREK